MPLLATHFKKCRHKHLACSTCPFSFSPSNVPHFCFANLVTACWRAATSRQRVRVKRLADLQQVKGGCSFSVKFEQPLLPGIPTYSNQPTPLLSMQKLAPGWRCSLCSEKTCSFIPLFKPGVKWVASLSASLWAMLHFCINPETPTCCRRGISVWLLTPITHPCCCLMRCYSWLCGVGDISHRWCWEKHIVSCWVKIEMHLWF